MNTHSIMSLLLMDLMKIVVILFSYGGGIILAVSLKGKQASYIVRALTYLLDVFICAGISFFLKTNIEDPSIINAHSLELFALTTIPSLYGIMREFSKNEEQKA